MPEEQKKTEEQPEDESQETPADEQPKDDSEQEQPAGEQPEDESQEQSNDEANEELGEEVPAEVLREKVTKANAEAANYRKKLREAEEKLKNAKTPEEVDEIVKQIQADREAGEAALLRENVALKYKLPEKLQKRLTGTTREALEADAKELAELFGSDEDDEDINLEGGLNPRGRGDDTSDPRSLAKRHGARRRR